MSAPVSFTEPAREIHVTAEYDVLVVGGGPAGLTAALAAAEDGMKVGLIESRSFVGGNMTIGLPVLGFLGQKGNQVIYGLPQKFIDRLKERDAASEHRPCPLHMGITLVEPEAVKTVGLEMLTEAGVDVQFYTFVAGVIMSEDERTIRGVVIESKSGRSAVVGKIVIDCSGDADVAYRAGVGTEKGNEHGGMQPPTLMFCLANVDTEKLRTSIAVEKRTYLTDFIPAEYFGQNHQFIVVGLRELIAKAREERNLDIPNERTIIITGLKKGEVWINMTRVTGTDGTDARSLTHGEIVARRQIDDITEYLINYVPGFEEAYFAKTAPFLGIRETRRIVGHYTMNEQDVLGCRHFPDAIAVASYPIDIHRPGDEGCTLIWCGDCYDIPYRSLLPQHVDNLIVAGRSISASVGWLSRWRRDQWTTFGISHVCSADDICQAGRALQRFDKIRGTLPPEHRDVGRYPDTDDLLMASCLYDGSSRASLRQMEKAVALAGSEVLFDASNWMPVRGDLFVLITPLGKFQYHPATGEFRDPRGCDVR